MKKVIPFANLCYFGKTLTLASLLICLFNLNSRAQMYYSRFANPANNYQLAYPEGVLCLYPGFTNASQVADTGLANYANVTGLISAGLICTGDEYAVRAKLALPGGITQVPAGHYAGFKIRLNTVLALSVLENNISLRTYLGTTLQETTNGSSLLNLSLLAASTEPAAVMFRATKPFDAVEIRMNTGVITVGLLFDYRFYYAFASATSTLPVKLSSFSALPEGNDVHLTWTSALEQNVSRYELERSQDGGTNFTRISTITAKGNTTTETKYSYTDGSVHGGNYVYRLKMIDRDGSAEYSKMASVKVSSNSKWKIYPTLLNGGQDITVNTNSTGSARSQVQISNLQGQVLESANVTGSVIKVPTGKLRSGIYVVKCYQNGELQASEKIVVR